MSQAQNWPTAIGHRFEHDLAGIDVAEKPEAQRDRPEENRNDFQPADDEEDEYHQDLQHARRVDPWARRDVMMTPPTPFACSAQTIQQTKKMQAIAKVRFRSAFAPRSSGRSTWKSPFAGRDGPSRWCRRRECNPNQFRNEDEDEDRGEEPEGLLHQVATDHRFEEVVETLHHPFPEVLQSGRHRLDFPRRHLRADDDARGDEPGHQHRVCDREWTDLKERWRIERQRVVFLAAVAGFQGWVVTGTVSGLLREARRGAHREGDEKQRQDEEKAVPHG